MNPRLTRFFVAASLAALGALLVWLSAAVPIASSNASGSALNGGPDGFSELAQGLRERDLLAPTVRLDATDDGIGLSPLTWDRWQLVPGDAILTIRSDAGLTANERAAADAFLRGGGRVAVLVETESHFIIADDISPNRLVRLPVWDGAFSDDPRHPIRLDGGSLYQFHEPFVLATVDSEWLHLTSELGWLLGEVPEDPRIFSQWPMAGEFPVGNGTVLVIGDSDPWSNAGRLELNNTELSTWLIDWLAAGGGSVFIDEAHRSAAVPIRLDLFVQSIPPDGRWAIVISTSAAVILAYAPWGGLFVPLSRLLSNPTEHDPVAALLAKHPDWNPSLLSQLASGTDRAGAAATGDTATEAGSPDAD